EHVRATEYTERTEHVTATEYTEHTEHVTATEYTEHTEHVRATEYTEHTEHASQPRIRTAAAVARLDKDVADFPRGCDTAVGERGITLSGEQKQRTALARALFVDPKILVLDDALSAVDTYTEEEILSRLRGVMRQRTAILVAHRISTVREA